jgi:hypothetical protein
MDDAPLPIADAAGTLAAPTRSLWQSDTVGIKICFNASWALRDARGLAWRREIAMRAESLCTSGTREQSRQSPMQ